MHNIYGTKMTASIQTTYSMFKMKTPRIHLHLHRLHTTDGLRCGWQPSVCQKQSETYSFIHDFNSFNCWRCNRRDIHATTIVLPQSKEKIVFFFYKTSEAIRMLIKQFVRYINILQSTAEYIEMGHTFHQTLKKKSLLAIVAIN